MRYISFKLNYRYYSLIPYKEDLNPHSRSRRANQLTEKLRNLMAIYRENLQHAQKLQKQAYNKVTKPESYAHGEKIWLNNKYIKTKYNQKLEANFFEFF